MVRWMGSQVVKRLVRLGWVNVVPPRELQMLFVNKRPLLRNRVDSNIILFEIFLFYPCVLAVNIYIHKVAFRSVVRLSVYNFYFDKSNNQKFKNFDFFNFFDCLIIFFLLTLLPDKQPNGMQLYENRCSLRAHRDKTGRFQTK